MSDKKMVVKTEFNIVDYVLLVESLAEEFFDEEGQFNPHYGKLNLMRCFYNECVIDSKFDLEHNITEAINMDVFANDDEFITEFNKAIKGNGNICLDFSNAYSDALKIVEAKRNSVGNITDVIKKAVSQIGDGLNSIMSGENFEKLLVILSEVSKGKLTPGKFIEAYENSERFQEVIADND